MKQELEALKKEVNDKHIEALAKIEALEKGLGKTDSIEIGKWYVVTQSLVEEKGKIGRAIGGYNNDTLYFTFQGLIHPYSATQVRLATEEEIKTHLIAEAKRRGFKEGVKIIPAKLNSCEDKDGFVKCCNEDFFFKYDAREDGLYCRKQWVYYSGQWATIVEKDPVIKIGGYEVEFKNGYITINACAFDKSDLIKIKEVLGMEQIRSLNVGCIGQYKVDSETINRILSRLK